MCQVLLVRAAWPSLYLLASAVPPRKGGGGGGLQQLQEGPKEARTYPVGWRRRGPAVAIGRSPQDSPLTLP